MTTNEFAASGSGKSIAQMILERARANNFGKRPWQVWKSFEAGEVVDLFEKSNKQAAAAGGDAANCGGPRVELLNIDFQSDLHIAYRVQMPVPRWPVDGKLQLGSSADFHLHYQEQWRWEAPAGWEPLGLFDPPDAYHPNMRPSLRGAICLGELPAGVPPKELVLMGYYALSLQNHVLDETDPHGVLNIPACEFYRNHQEYLPLTHAGLADPWQPPIEETETGTIKI